MSKSKTRARPNEEKGIVDLGGETWLKHKPKPLRDIRKLKKNFIKRDAAEAERKTRRKIILNKALLRAEDPESIDRSILRILGQAEPRVAAPITCCSLLARRFQIFFVDRGLQVDTKAREDIGEPVFGTFLDLTDATNDLETVNIRELHDTFRHRLQTNLGNDVVIVGFLEVEWDGTRKVWQPHHHLVIYGTSPRALRRLRNKHYLERQGQKGPRPMRIEQVKNIAGAFSYMSKLVAFAKMPRKGRKPKRVRLRPPLLREYMRFLARHRPTEFVFCVNCSVVKKRRNRG